MRKFLFLFLLFILVQNVLQAQVDGVDFLIEYNDSISLYDCKIVIQEGNAFSLMDRAQSNSTFTIVVPAGRVLTVQKSYEPKAYSAPLTPIEWAIHNSMDGPPITPELKYVSITPGIGQLYVYNNLYEGDTITIFSVYSDVEPCENRVRLFENGSDPTSVDMPDLIDYTNGFTFGNLDLVYHANLVTVYEPSCNCDPVNDSLEMVKFFNNFNGPNWENPWDLEKPIEDWIDSDFRGIEKNDLGCIVEIVLPIISDPNFDGELYDFDFPFLEKLQFGEFTQGVSGNLIDFEKLPKLQSLRIASDSIYSTIPNYQNLPNLTDLDLRGKNITGQIPDFNFMLNLQNFCIEDCNLVGAVPSFEAQNNFCCLSLYNTEIDSVTSPIEGGAFFVPRNRFTFSDISMFIRYAENDYFYHDQKDIPARYTYISDTLDFKYDEEIDSCTYYLYENYELIDSSNNSDFIIDFEIDNLDTFHVEWISAKFDDVYPPDIERLRLKSSRFILSDIVSILESNVDKNNIKVFPNPSSDLINIELNYDEIEKLILTDFQGQMVFTSSQSVNNVAQLPKGIYLLNIIGKSGRCYHSKVVVK